MKKITFTISILFLILLTPLFANESENFVNQIFKELDVNRDGIIEKKDIEKFSKKEFDLINKSKNERITKDEFFEYVCNKSCLNGNCECKQYKNKSDLYYLKEYWERIDKNNDGFITREEKRIADFDHFYSLDNNTDGKVTKEELEAQLY